MLFSSNNPVFTSLSFNGISIFFPFPGRRQDTIRLTRQIYISISFAIAVTTAASDTEVKADHRHLHQ